jgi:hypothetical protein
MLPPVTRPATAAVTSSTPSLNAVAGTLTQRSGIAPRMASGSTSLATARRSASVDMSSARQRRGEDAGNLPRSLRPTQSAPRLGASPATDLNAALGLLTDRMEAPDHGASLDQMMMAAPAPAGPASRSSHSPVRQPLPEPPPGTLGQLTDRLEAPDDGMSLEQMMRAPTPTALAAPSPNSPLRQQLVQATTPGAAFERTVERRRGGSQPPSIMQALTQQTDAAGRGQRTELSAIRQQLQNLGRGPTPPAPNPAGAVATPAPLSAPTMTMNLHNQRLQMGDTSLDNLVQAVLGKPENRFQLLDPQHHLLLDTGNRLLHAHAGPGAVSVLKASVPLSSPLPCRQSHSNRAQRRFHRCDRAETAGVRAAGARQRRASGARQTLAHG